MVGATPSLWPVGYAPWPCASPELLGVNSASCTPLFHTPLCPARMANTSNKTQYAKRTIQARKENASAACASAQMLSAPEYKEASQLTLAAVSAAVAVDWTMMRGRECQREMTPRESKIGTRAEIEMNYVPSQRIQRKPSQPTSTATQDVGAFLRMKSMTSLISHKESAPRRH